MKKCKASSMTLLFQDTQTCCFTQQSQLYGDLIHYNLGTNAGGVTTKDLSSNWVVEKATLNKHKSPDDPK